MTDDRPADLVLTGGRIATMDAPVAGRARSPCATGGSSRSGRTRRSPPHVGPSTRVIELRGRTVTPGLPGRPRPSGPRRARHACAASSTTTRGRARLPRRSSPTYARTHPDEPWIRGGGWYMDDFPGGTPRREDLDRDRPGSAGLPDQSRRPRRVGQHAGRSSSAGVDGRHAGPRRRPHRARPGRHAERHAARGRDGPRRAVRCRTTRRPTSRRPCASARPPALARDHGLAGRHRPTGRPRSAPTWRWPRAASSPARVVGAMWWEHHRGAEQIEEFVERRRGDVDRPLRADERQADDGRRPRELHRRDARAVRRRARRHDRQPRPAPDRPRGAATWVPQLDALGFQPHFHAIGDARCGRRSTPWRPPRAARTAHPTRGRTSPTSRSSIPTTSALPRARRGRQRAAAVGLPRRPDGRPDDPVPRRPVALAVPVPLAAGRRRRPRDGLRLERLDREPAARDARSPSSAIADVSRGDREAFLPDERLELDRRAGRVHGGLGLRQPPRRRDRHARGRQGGRSRRPRPRPVRPRRRRDRRGAAWSARSSTAWPCTRTRRSGAEVGFARPHGRMTMPNSASNVGVDERGVGRCSCCEPEGPGTQKGAIKQ